MKKYITITTFIAAGTLLGNATELKDASYSKNFSTGDASITANGTGSISGSFSFTLVYDVEKAKALFGQSSSRQAFAYIVNSGSDHCINLSSALNNTGFVGTTKNNLGTPPTGGNSSETRYPMTTEGSTPATNDFADSKASGNLCSKLSLLTGLSTTLAHTDKQDSSLYVTLTFSDGTKSELYGKNTNLKWSGGFGDFSSLTVNPEYIKSGYVFNSALDQVTAFKINAQAIPEPSMFGVLAGMGALALVVSRRRRRK